MLFSLSGCSSHTVCDINIGIWKNRLIKVQFYREILFIIHRLTNYMNVCLLNDVANMLTLFLFL